MKANTAKEAWTLANEIFPTDYIKNETASERGGYNIYESTLEGCHAWISDLGDRLEINLDNGKTINIWIEAEEAAETTESTPENERPAEAKKTPAEHTETIITLSIDIYRDNHPNHSKNHLETSITLSPETALKDIATFERQASIYIQEARKAARGNYCYIFVDLSKARYRFTSCADLKQIEYQAWSGRGDDITVDGVHLNPCERYNDDPAHDMWITGNRNAILTEITI